MVTNLGRDEYLLDRFSSRSTVASESDMTTVGRRQSHRMNIGPWISDHFWNWIDGCDFGMSNLLPMNGSGRGPGGMRWNRTRSEMRTYSNTEIGVKVTKYQEDNTLRSRFQRRERHYLCLTTL
jgi:hypothetical protein